VTVALARALAGALVVMFPAPTAAQAPASRPDCSAAEYRQFDFWVGTWDVTAQGKPAGTNRIEVDLKGCVLVEHWTATRGGRGTSLNFYDRDTRSWHQTWMDEQGNALRLAGALREGRMVLESAPQRQRDGASTVQRITWTPNADGTVRQIWEQSTDTKTWTMVFDGLYTRRGSP
jgi:hypothetical protein